MPLPIIIGAYVGAAAALGAYAAWRNRRQSVYLVVLGASMSGKTTLINSWRGEWVTDYNRTQSTVDHGRIKVTANGQRITFVKIKDFSGAEDQYDQWGAAAQEGTYLVYLVHADVLVNEEDRARQGRLPHPSRRWRRLLDDVGQINPWLRDGKAQRCVIVVTHTDQDPRRERLGADRYHEHVREQLAEVVLRLGGEAKVRVITGSLATLDAAAETTDRIMAGLTG